MSNSSSVLLIMGLLGSNKKIARSRYLGLGCRHAQRLTRRKRMTLKRLTCFR